MDTPFSFADNIIATKYFNDQGSSTFSKWSNVKSLSCAMNRGVDPPTVPCFCVYSADLVLISVQCVPKRMRLEVATVVCCHFELLILKRKRYLILN